MNQCDVFGGEYMFYFFYPLGIIYVTMWIVSIAKT